MEEWRSIDGYGGLYEVSNFGNVRSLGNERAKKTKLIKPILQNNGYLSVCLSKSGQRVIHSIHRLVATAFIPNAENKPVVNHINCDKFDNRASNLEWCTQKENVKHTWDLGRGKVPNNKGRKRRK